MRVGIMFLSFNRPKYLRRALNSYAHSGQEVGDLVFFQDIGGPEDATKVKECVRLISAHKHPNKRIVIRKIPHGADGNLIAGFEEMFSKDYDVVFYMEDDSVVCKEFFPIGLAIQDRMTAVYSHATSTQFPGGSGIRGYTEEKAIALLKDANEWQFHTGVRLGPNMPGTTYTRAVWDTGLTS